MAKLSNQEFRQLVSLLKEKDFYEHEEHLQGANREMPVLRPERMRKCNVVAESKVFANAVYQKSKAIH